MKKLELSFDEFLQLKQYCEKVGICFLSTPFDFDSIAFLSSIDMPFWKVPSGEVTNLPYLLALAKTGKPVVMSTGMCEMKEIEAAINVLRENGTKDIKLLHCNTEYPTPYEALNLRTIGNMEETFNCIVGLSDHSMGSAVDVAAVTMGASIIEKHLTLSRADGGPDGAFSMEPQEFKTMITDIRNVEKSLGRVTYDLTEAQIRGRKNARSLYVVKDMKKGDIFTNDNIKSIRPGRGLPTWHLDEIMGKRAATNLKVGTAMKWEYVDKEEL